MATSPTVVRAARPVRPGDNVYLIDASGYIFRAYHALPQLNRKSDGLPTNAIHGFCGMLNKLLREMKKGEAPTHIAAVFDKSERTFRNRIYAGYKANRTPAPDDLVPQFSLIRVATRAFAVPCIEQDDVEADDLIATYARKAASLGASVRIVSSDKDLMQLVTDRIRLYDTMRDRDIGEAEVREKFGVPPNMVIDVQALAGDSIDNVPGVPGIGVKTGAKLITEFGSLESLLERAHEVKQPKCRERLIEFAAQARMSKELVTLKDDVELEQPLDNLAVAHPNAGVLIGFLKALEFTVLMRRIAADIGADAQAIEAVPIAIEGWPPGAAAPAPHAAEAAPVPPQPAGVFGQRMTPDEAVEQVLRAVRGKLAPQTYETVTDHEALARWIALIRDRGLMAIDARSTAGDPLRGDLAGLGIAVAPGRACYVPFGHRSSSGLDFQGQSVRQLAPADAIAALKPVLEAPGVLKIGHDLKTAYQAFARLGVEITPNDDVMLMSYACELGLNGHGLTELSQKHLAHKPLVFKEVAGSGKSRITFDLLSLDQATTHAAEAADVTLRLWMLFETLLVAKGKTTVYQTLERPLIGVLAAMERRGILVDRPVLARLSGEFAQTCARLEARIHALAGGPFNIGSPKQLGDILFGKMGLPGGRKTATGAWSTDANALEELAAQGIELARTVLDWRQTSKLKSTYTDALPDYIHPETGRVHTTYALASTSTGRLSSNEPNLQNIPIRTEEGRRIRTAFVAPRGAKLVSADYSQIELRVLAHVADIPQLRRAFAEGRDIHAMTAGEMFNVPVEGMDPQVRRRAKAINFGIIYGISAFGLANQLGIGREEAGEYIRTYFKRFPGIRDYMEGTRKFCRDNGYVETVFGRRCHFPRIAVGNPSERAFQERAAINAPIQGSAADIMRRAMIRMPAALKEAGLEACMLLQVHDELVFEAQEDEVEATMRIARAIMEKAPEPAVHFSVPIAVDARAAGNWDEAH
jgi:DNA polymerase-1